MIDDKKIEEAANKHIETEYARYNSGEVEEEMICLRGKDSFKEGAKWAINEFLKDLWHPNTEEPDKSKGDIINIGVEWLKDITSPSKVKTDGELNDNGDRRKQIGSSGYYAKIDSTGEDSVIMCAGNSSRAKAKLGS